MIFYLKKTCRCKKITLYLQINMYSRELYNCVEVVQFIIPWNKSAPASD